MALTEPALRHTWYVLLDIHVKNSSFFLGGGDRVVSCSTAAIATLGSGYRVTGIPGMKFPRRREIHDQSCYTGGPNRIEVPLRLLGLAFPTMPAGG